MTILLRMVLSAYSRPMSMVTSTAMMHKEVTKTVSWYAYGIGLVKQETYDKKGELQSETLLDSFLQ